MNFAGIGAPLGASALRYAMERLAVDAPAIWAVLTVETAGCGFLADRRPKILFERHVFSRRTGGSFDAVDPGVSHPKAGGYGAGGANQYARLARAMQLDADEALKSASWGLGQIMGFNAEVVGYDTPADMIDAFRDSEDHQIAAMMGFVVQEGLAGHLRSRRWADFARGYNGVNFQKNGYDAKLAKFHARYSVGPMPDLLVRWVQMALITLGIPGVGGVDGWYGDNTQKAVLRFQAREQLDRSGTPDAATIERLALLTGWAVP